MSKIERDFNNNVKIKTRTKKELGPDHFQITVSDGDWMTVTVVKRKDYYKRLLILR